MSHPTNDELIELYAQEGMDEGILDDDLPDYINRRMDEREQARLAAEADIAWKERHD